MLPLTFQDSHRLSRDDGIIGRKIENGALGIITVVIREVRVCQHPGLFYLVQDGFQ